ncbi:hypothetical protein OS493_020833 [Desmophyllum pertusum]|uniref:Uncharacterized protein n=1 Tax=Desmophyllum pertusum TaxID=174260 RepID=A0A9W9YEG8_9CNID|nr:hypothetical protein OS493_020833 [Desmophyllum pertusum]
MEHFTSAVIDFEVIDKKETGGNSTTMEKEALQHLLEKLAVVLPFDELTTDASPAVIRHGTNSTRWTRGKTRRGHMTRDCRSRKKCEVNGCQRFHHHLLHADPPTASRVASVLDKNSISQVVRVRFRAANGRVQEGNVQIYSGAATTVIRKDFARPSDCKGNESVDLAVVGRETIRQPESRRVKFWIYPLESSEEFSIEATRLRKQFSVFMR